MEKRKWLWKRKSSEKSPGESESSGSISSHSERYSDDQEALKASPNHNTQSPEFISKAAVSKEEIIDSVKILTEKLSAALVNVSAKEDLVKQHSKVAEEAVAGWEKAENEVAVLKQELEAAIQQNLALEDRVSHLDGALKECVRQLRQGREEQEQKIEEALLEKTCEFESTKVELEGQLLQFQAQAVAAKSESLVSVDPDLHIKLESLEKENAALKLKLLSQSEELEISTIERDLSAQAAETASKQHLESIKKVTKLEAECRRLQAVTRKSSSANDQKSLAASSIYVESLTDSQSDTGERLNALQNVCEPSCTDSWALALITELDQFKNEKTLRKSITGSSLEIDIMDDFLEMERLAALPETETRTQCLESVVDANQLSHGENPLKAEFEAMKHRVAGLEEKLEKIEAEKDELEKALTASQDSVEASQSQLKEVEMRLEELQKELTAVNELKELLESQLIGIEVEARTMSAKVGSLNEEVEKERNLSAEMAVKCRELEDELTRKSQEIELQQTAISNGKPKHDPILQWFKSHPNPPVAIVSDFFLGWTQDLAVHLGVPRVTFWPSAAFTASVSNSLWRNLPKSDDPTNENSLISFPEIPNTPKYPWWQIIPYCRNFNEGDPEHEFLRNCMLANNLSWGVVFNSFTELERVYIDHVKKEMGHDRVWALGPLLPPPDEVGPTDRGGSSAVPVHEVMTWLDGKADDSVVYVCFGSRLGLTSQQTEVLAAALKQSGVHFIWCGKAVNQGHGAGDIGLIPDGFEDRVEGRGLIIRGWAPQVAILSHRAVGAFVSHCGWNSVLEGVAAGVLMLAWPLAADQFTDVKLLVDQLGVAVRASPLIQCYDPTIAPYLPHMASPHHAIPSQTLQLSLSLSLSFGGLVGLGD